MKTIARVLAAALIAFALPAAGVIGGVTLLERVGHQSLIGTRALIVAGFMLPFVAFAFLARPFGRWRDLDDRARGLCIVLSALY